MKNLLFSIACLSIFMMGCGDSNNDQTISSDIIKNPHSAGDNKDEKLPEMTFEEERIDFGQVVEGEKVVRLFEFENTGDAELLIFNVTAACGCTVPNNWPKTPVKPGEKGSIEVEFDSTDRVGQVTKKITISANTNPATIYVALAGLVNEANE